MLRILLALTGLLLAGPASALTDAEIATIVNKVVPDYQYRADPAQCPAGVRLHDARGTVARVDGKAGLRAGNAPVCVVGPEIRGTKPRTRTWSQVKSSAFCDNGVSFGAAAGTVTVLGAYFDNCADPIAPPKSPSTTRALKLDIRHTYARWVRDDFVENDACLDERVSDVLVDNTWVFISARPGRGNSVKHSATHDVVRALVHLGCQPDPRGRSDHCKQSGWSTYIPFKWSSCGGRTNIADSIFKIDGPAGQGDIGFKPGTYGNVHLVWGGTGKFPGHVPAGVTVHQGGEGSDGEKLWSAARAKWLAQHGCDPAGDDCAMTDASGNGDGPRPPPSQDFPVSLDAANPTATVGVDLQRPENATAAIVTLMAYDADWGTEGEAWVNGSGPVVLFGDQTDGDKKVLPVHFTVPADCFQDGANEITFKWRETAGYRIEGIVVEFETEATEGPEPEPELEPERESC